MKFVATKNGLKKIFFTPVFCCCFWIRDPGYEIRDPGWVKIRIRDKHLGSATLVGVQPIRERKNLLSKYEKILAFGVVE